jgi:hypothetical protein
MLSPSARTIVRLRSPLEATGQGRKILLPIQLGRLEERLRLAGEQCLAGRDQEEFLLEAGGQGSSRLQGQLCRRRAIQRNQE